jgi:cobalamin biosynthesis Mg chelatase CobN
VARIASRIALVVAALLIGTMVAVARPAAAATPCWKVLLNDWYDGRIDHTYAIHCYTEALKHLPPDVSTYSSAHDDIERALQSAIAIQTKDHKKVNPNTEIPPPPKTATTTGVSNTNPLTKSTNPHHTGGSGGGTTTTQAKPGGITKVSRELDPGSADSLPVPLLVLGGLALLLVLAGAGGLVFKRFRTR